MGVLYSTEVPQWHFIDVTTHDLHEDPAWDFSHLKCWTV